MRVEAILGQLGAIFITSRRSSDSEIVSEAAAPSRCAFSRRNCSISASAALRNAGSSTSPASIWRLSISSAFMRGRGFP